MKLGLITDIHEQVELLATALRQLRLECVEQIILLGDISETGESLAATCKLLANDQVLGVWGNHDYGLCVEPDDEMCDKYGRQVIDYMASLKPRLEVAGCLFQHVEPWLNPQHLDDLWYFDGPPDTPEKRARIFAASPPYRLMFAGHYHRWLLATPDEFTSWNGQSPVRLAAPQRYFVVVGALCEGQFATLDTDTWELVPHQCLEG